MKLTSFSLAAAAMLLSACGGGAKPAQEEKEPEPPVTQGKSVAYHELADRWGTVQETEIKLRDGRVTTCLVYYRSGISCLEPQPR